MVNHRIEARRALLPRLAEGECRQTVARVGFKIIIRRHQALIDAHIEVVVEIAEHYDGQSRILGVERVFQNARVVLSAVAVFGG